MNGKKRGMREILLALLLLFSSINAFSAGEEEMGQAAERAGKLREALTHYAAAIGYTYEDDDRDGGEALREKIIQIAQKLDPPPAIPEEGKRSMVRGETIFKEARSESDYEEAVAEFEDAVKAAPWWAEAYYNLGLANEGANEFDGAIQNFKLYLLASPGAKDAEEVKNKIWSLEIKRERAGQVAMDQQAAREAELKAAMEKEAEERIKQGIRQSLATGRWWETEKRSYAAQSTTRPVTMRVSGDEFSCQWDYVDGSGMILKGSIDGLSVSGTATAIICCPKISLPGSFTGSVSADGRSVNIHVVQDASEYDYKLWRQ